MPFLLLSTNDDDAEAINHKCTCQTCAYRILAAALTNLNKKGLNNEFATKYYVLNPKSISMGQLYGQVRICCGACAAVVVG